MQYLIDTLTDKDNLKLVREKAIEFYKMYDDDDKCWNLAMELYKSEHFQIQEIGVFILGYISSRHLQSLNFLKDTVSGHSSWKVQEVLAMAFDSFCKETGYEKSILTIKEWINSEKANVRRAVTEGLRIWTSRPYFKEHPNIAIDLIAPLRNDESEYVRKSGVNSLRDFSKNFPELIKNELNRWDISSKQVMQVYKLAGKLVFTK
ncbi:DNA alkylation repair protein [Lutispora sp.]|uniref:DNA alkylation repair protein n=1 Tax=Lutispora sp. TaxID=2828727 RepID=UPI003FA56A3E